MGNFTRASPANCYVHCVPSVGVGDDGHVQFLSVGLLEEVASGYLEDHWSCVGGLSVPNATGA